MQNEVKFKLLTGSSIIPFVDKIAQFRMENFREFPYLYASDVEFEKKYLEIYQKEEKAILIIGIDQQDEIIAISTGMPVTNNADLLSVASEMFKKNNLNPDDYFYIAETIISAPYRSKGLYSKIVAMREQAALDLGYSKVCFITVIREPHHPQQPAHYQSPETIFNHCGYKKSSIIIHYTWPTIQPDNTVSDQKHALVFWFKSLR